jgi:fatty-acyl-CoA synthase
MVPTLFQKLWSRDGWAGLPVHRSLLTPLSFLEHTLHVMPEKQAVVDGARRLTWRDFGERV